MALFGRVYVGGPTLALFVCACLGRAQAPLPAIAVAPPRSVESEVLKSARTSDGLELETNTGLLKISAPRSDTFRVHVARSRNARVLPSFAVDANALHAGPAPSIEESDTLLLLRTEHALLRVDKKP